MGRKLTLISESQKSTLVTNTNIFGGPHKFQFSDPHKFHISDQPKLHLSDLHKFKFSDLQKKSS